MKSPSLQAPKIGSIAMQPWEILALQSQRKTQFRVPLAKQPDSAWSIPPARLYEGYLNRWGCSRDKESIRCPYSVGQELFVAEKWADTNGENGPMISYFAGGDRFLVDESYPVDYSLYPDCQFAMWCGDLRRGEPDHFWRRAAQMPAWASRFRLTLESIKVQRVSEISEADAIAEGALSKFTLKTPGFLELFYDRYGDKLGIDWSSSFVWACTFRMEGK